jgi:hypothetical protein
MFDQALGLPVHICQEFIVLLLFGAWFARSAPVGLLWFASLNFIEKCLVSGIELFVVAFELLAVARSRWAFILPRCALETLWTALPA